MSMEKEIPTVFISYAWEDDVQQYAIDIGTRLLNEEGIEVLLDVWDTHVACIPELCNDNHSKNRCNDWYIAVFL